MRKYHVFRASLALFVALALAAGCNNATPPAAKPAPKTPPPASVGTDDGQDHAAHGPHGAGPHDGAVADWGGGKYHVEFTVDHDKQEATVYVLGDDEKTPAPVKAETLLLSISDPKFQVELAPAPLDGEEDGLCSRFVGQDEKLGVVQEFAGTISGEIEGTPYAGDFKEETHK